MAEYGTFGCTALKLDIGTESLYLGPGLAYLYGTFGCTVGKLVGQNSGSNRVSHSWQESTQREAEAEALPFPARRAGEGVVYQRRRGEPAQEPVSRCRG